MSVISVTKTCGSQFYATAYVNVRSIKHTCSKPPLHQGECRCFCGARDLNSHHHG